jgi:hypothetical protein
VSPPFSPHWTAGFRIHVFEIVATKKPGQKLAGLCFDYADCHLSLIFKHHDFDFAEVDGMALGLQ